MEKNYFTLDEDFEEIIKNSLPDKQILSTKQITTGWTNIVYEVKTTDGNFFFRFPRDDFWSRTIVKDHEFSQFINGKTDFNTAELNLLYDNGRPFSVHKKIYGHDLATKIKDMTPEEIKVVANDVAKFMYQLHHIPFNQNNLFKTNEVSVKLVNFLDELLSVHVDPKDKVFWKYEDFSKKDNNCLVHGDLNLSNIIIDDSNHISAIIDFGFSGFGNKYYDIARIFSRDYPEDFRNEVIKCYQQLENAELNTSVLNNEIDIWKNIDGAYINYMRSIGIYE